jgi:hypothetical protein
MAELHEAKKDYDSSKMTDICDPKKILKVNVVCGTLL